MWKLRIDDDQANRAMVNLVRDEYSIGRAENNAIRLTERTVSRQHAKVVRRNDKWFIVPLSQSQKTLVDGTVVSEEAPLAHGVVVRIGDYRLELRDDTARGTRSDPRAATQPAVPRGQSGAEPNRFVVIDGPTPGTQYPLFKRSLLIGRGEECDISLNDTSVSRVHAEIARNDTGGYQITDRGSSNGVRVNGADIPQHTLEGGDMIELGDVVLRYLAAGDPSWPPEEDIAAPTRNPPTAKSRLDGKSLGLYLVGGVALGAVVVFLLGRAEPAERDAKPIASVASPAELALHEALAMLEADNVIGAHRKLGEVPMDSALRSSEDFVKVEQRWADLLFVAAEGEPDRDLKRKILDQISRAPAVDAERRRRAADMLAALDEPSESLDELPKTKDAAERRAAPPASDHPASGQPAPTGGANTGANVEHAPRAALSAPKEPTTAAGSGAVAPAPKKAAPGDMDEQE